MSSAPEKAGPVCTDPSIPAGASAAAAEEDEGPASPGDIEAPGELPMWRARWSPTFWATLSATSCWKSCDSKGLWPDEPCSLSLLLLLELLELLDDELLELLDLLRPWCEPMCIAFFFLTDEDDITKSMYER